MISVNDCINLVEEFKTNIPNINYGKVVIDDSQLVKDLDHIRQADNQLLYVVIPSSSNQGSDDALKKNNEMMFLVLQKAYHDINHNQFLALVNETQLTAKAIEDYMLIQKGEGCGLFHWLAGASIKIDPIWDFAGCHGWTISFSMLT